MSTFPPRVILVSVAIAFIALAGAWYFSYRTHQLEDNRPPTILLSAWKQALSGSTTNAARDAAAFLEDAGPADPYRIWAQSILSESSFNAATTTAQMIEAARLMKTNFVEAQSASLKAALLNRIAGALYEWQREGPYEAVFEGEPFASYRGDTPNASIKNLVGYSIDVHPTSAAYLILARQEADAIVLNLQPGSSHPLNDSAAASKAMTTRVAHIEEYVERADSLIDADMQRSAASPYGATILPWYYFWRGYALGAAARVDAKYLHDAENSFQQAIGLAAVTKDTEGLALPILGIIATKTELAYARMLHAVSGEARANDVRMHLARFVDALQQDPSLYPGFYNFFEQAKYGRDVELDAKYRALYRAYTEYAALARLSPEFYAFLAELEWEL